MPHGQDAGYLGCQYSPVALTNHEVGTRPRRSGSTPAIRGGSESKQGIALSKIKLQQGSHSELERYGNSSFGRNCLRARQLVEAGARFVTVNAYDTIFGPSWDLHGYAPFCTFQSLRETVGPAFDLGYSALIGDLGERGLLETTTVVAVGEFGRSPRINWQGGRDHHSLCWSGLLAGGKIRGGRTIGNTDKIGYLSVERPVTIQEFSASIYHSLDIPCNTVFYDNNLQAHRLVDQNVRPIHELF